MDKWNKKDEIIWGNVERLRKERKLSLSKLAKLAGSTPQSVNFISTRQRGIGPSLLKRFAKALGASEAELMREQSGTNDNLIFLTRKKYKVDRLLDSLTRPAQKGKRTAPRLRVIEGGKGERERESKVHTN